MRRHRRRECRLRFLTTFRVPATPRNSCSSPDAPTVERREHFDSSIRPGHKSTYNSVRMKRNVRTGLEAAEIKRDILDNLFYVLGKFPEVATRNDWYLALAYTVRDRLLNRWVQSAYQYYEHKVRTVSYLSAEFLIGPQLAM